MNEKNSIEFIPYSQMPYDFNGTIDQFNELQKPNKTPLTTFDYKCSMYK